MPFPLIRKSRAILTDLTRLHKSANQSIVRLYSVPEQQCCVSSGILGNVRNPLGSGIPPFVFASDYQNNRTLTR